MTNESWEDLRTVICGTVDHIAFYSKKFGDDFIWDFSSGGSDVCELHFANQRAEGHGGAVTARNAKRAADRSMTTALWADSVGGNTKYFRPKNPEAQKALEKDERKGKAVSWKKKYK